MIIQLLLTLSLFSSSIGNINQPNDTARSQQIEEPSVKQAVLAIRSIPDGARLLKEVEQEGRITIELREIESFDFGAMWDANSRHVIVNAKRCRNQGTLISSLLFELHNAKTSQFLEAEANKVINGRLTKEQYVKNVERMEHDNAMATIKILEEGMANGAFPKTAKWTIIRDFEDHYKLQQVTGHSLWIANNYDLMSPLPLQAYCGTIAEFESLTEDDKRELAYYLSIKNKLNSPSADDIKIGYKYIQDELDKVVDCELYPFLDEDGRHESRKRNLGHVFRGEAVYEDIAHKIALIPIVLHHNRV